MRKKEARSRCCSAASPPHLCQLVHGAVELEADLGLAQDGALQQQAGRDAREVGAPRRCRRVYSRAAASTRKWRERGKPSAWQASAARWACTAAEAASQHSTCSSRATSSIFSRLAGSFQAFLLATKRVVLDRMVSTICARWFERVRDRALVVDGRASGVCWGRHGAGSSDASGCAAGAAGALLARRAPAACSPSGSSRSQ